MEKIGILGGTFDPVHIEHISLAKSAIAELKLDRLVVMPTFIPPHKSTLPAPAEDRLNMLKLAFSAIPEIEVSDFEIQKQGKSFTYQTVEHYKQKYDCELYFIVGGDMLKDFKNWRYPERILSACTLTAFGREDYFLDERKEQQYFIQNFKTKFIPLKYIGKVASSTKIREFNRLDLDIDGLTAPSVAQYIKEKGLYRGDIYSEFVVKNLPQKRLVHTANVVVTALKKAKALKLDSEKVRISATLHDCAKYFDHQKVVGFTLPEGVPQPVIHAFLGAFVAQNYLGVTDEEVLDAIRFHTSGKADMTTLGKLIFVADMVEDGRSYEGVDKLRELYEKDDFEACFKECLKEEVLHLLNKKQYIYAETLSAYDYYIKD